METKKMATETGLRVTLPEVRNINTSDLIDALKKGIGDFNTRPTHYMFLLITYPILMIILARTIAGYDVLPIIFPVIAGSTLLGPFAACGMYELSRRMENGQDSHWTHCFDVFRSPAIFSILALGITLGIIFLLWLIAAEAIYASIYGNIVPESFSMFFMGIFTTPTGWTLMLVGCAVGFAFAAVVLAISVVAFPFLLDKHVNPFTAVLTSVKAVARNPIMMAFWGFIVASALLLGALPFGLGLSIVMPVLGHATWHLYRKVVAV